MSAAVTETWEETSSRHRVTVEEFGRMAEAGVFDPDVRVELIEGEILEMSPMLAPHAFAVAALTQLFIEQLRRRAVVWVQSSVICGEQSQPEPDVALLRGPLDEYDQRLPEPESLYLVIEVADSSFTRDQLRKLPLYAKFGIVEAWLVDVQNHAVEVWTKPGGAGYEHVTRHSAGDTISPMAFPDVTIRVADVFPAQRT